MYNNYSKRNVQNVIVTLDHLQVVLEGEGDKKGQGYLYQEGEEGITTMHNIGFHQTFKNETKTQDAKYGKA